MSLKVVLMGTGTFALPTFRRLYETRHSVVGLFTQPDRKGRGHHHHPHPVKEMALAAGTPVLQPESVNAPQALEQLAALQPDLCIVAAYGQILSADVIAIPRLGAVNLHASILPKYRGAAPVQYAILNGETETGVTIFQIEPKLDAGRILAIAKLEIGERETAGELEARLAELAAPLTVELLDDIEAGRAAGIPQDPAGVTRAPRLKKHSGLIDWSRSPVEIDRHVRAMQPWPKAFTFLHRPGHSLERLIVLEVDRAPAETESQVPEGPPGTLVGTPDGRLLVRAGEGIAEVLRLQPAGKRPLTAAEFLRGHPLDSGETFQSDGTP